MCVQLDSVPAVIILAPITGAQCARQAVHLYRYKHPCRTQLSCWVTNSLAASLAVCQLRRHKAETACSFQPHVIKMRLGHHLLMNVLTQWFLYEPVQLFPFIDRQFAGCIKGKRPSVQISARHRILSNLTVCAKEGYLIGRFCAANLIVCPYHAPGHSPNNAKEKPTIV